MIILITGLHGFVGNNLVCALRGHDIYGVSSSVSEKNKDVKLFTWDEIDKVPHVDIVIHLAGKAHDTRNMAKAQEYFDVNTKLTQRIFDWFVESSAEKFIFFSSVSAVTRDLNGILTEDMPLTPKGPYGESKMRAEKYIEEYWDYAVKKQKKCVYILRPCMIHGSGNKGNLNLLYKFVAKGIPWPLGVFDNQRSFVSMDNVSYVINRLITDNIVSGVYNLADDDTLSTNEVIRIMCEVMRRKCRIWYISKNAMINIAKLGDVLNLPLNQERFLKLTQDFIVSNEKIKKALSIDRLPHSAKEGIINTFRFFII